MGIAALDQTCGIPLYRQIALILEREIDRTCAPDDALPPERILAERFGVNRHTLRRAIDILEEKGMVARRKGSGIYVLDRPVDYAISSRTRFTASLVAAGHFPQTRVLRKQVVRAVGGVATRLRLAEGTEVAWLEILRLAEGRTFSIASHFLPLAHGQTCLDAYDGGSLHGFLRGHAGLTLTRTLSLITARLPDREDARLLQSPAHLPILRVKSVNVNAVDGQPAEYVVTRFRSDRVQLAVDIAELAPSAPAPNTKEAS